MPKWSGISPPEALRWLAASFASIQKTSSSCAQAAAGRVDHLLADRASDADWLRTALDEQNTTAVIPPKSNQRFPATFDKDVYKWRHLIEDCFGKLKEDRGIATRSCKTDLSFAAFISLAATVIQLR